MVREQTPGDVATRLPNGATVIARRFVNNNTAVFLAVTDGRQAQPYVTWVGRHDGWGTGAGHYFGRTELGAAVQDFETR